MQQHVLDRIRDVVDWTEASVAFYNVGIRLVAGGIQVWFEVKLRARLPTRLDMGMTRNHATSLTFHRDSRRVLRLLRKSILRPGTNKCILVSCGSTPPERDGMARAVLQAVACAMEAPRKQSRNHDSDNE